MICCGFFFFLTENVFIHFASCSSLNGQDVQILYFYVIHKNMNICKAMQLFYVFLFLLVNVRTALS